MTIYGAIPRAAYRQQPRRQPRSYHFEKRALEFDTTNYIDCGADPSLDIVNAITIEAMVNINALGASEHIIGKYGAPGNRSYILYFQGVQQRYSLYIVGADLTNKEAFSPLSTAAVYQHAVGTYDKTNIVTYLNGVAGVPVGYAQPIAVSVVNLWVADIVGAPGFRWDGLIAYVRVYKDIALTQEEVRWNMVNYNNPVHPGNLVLWLPMDEGSGLIVVDHSGLGNNGALLPAPTPPTWERVKQWELRSETE